MTKVITLNVRLNVDGKEQLVSATTNVTELRKALDEIKGPAAKAAEMMQRLYIASEGMSKFAEVMQNVTTKMRSYQTELSKAAQMTGLQGKELTTLRNSAQAVADTFGEDVGEVLKASNSLSKAFGLSASDALRLIQDGLVGGANANGEFIDTLKEYPRYFKEAGITAEEFVAITTNAAKQGVFSDKGVDAIKEGNLRIREMTTATAAALDGIGISSAEVQRQLQAGSITTFQVMQQVAAKLKELPASSSAVGTAIADIFGGPGEDAGLEYLKSLEDIELNMDNVREGADDFSKSLGQQADQQAKVVNGLTNIIDLTDAFNAVAPYLNVSAQLGMTLQGLTSVIMAFKALNVQSLLATLRNSAFVKSIFSLISGSTKWHYNSRLMIESNAGLATSGYAAAGGFTAMKIALRGLLIATGVGAAIAIVTYAVSALIDAFESSDESTDKFAENMNATQRVAQQAADTFKQTSAQTYSQLQSKYAQLQSAWERLTTAHQKNEWIKENQSAFQELGITVNSASDAEDAFVKNTSKIEQSFKRRAEAAAYAAVQTELYERKLRLEMDIRDADKKAQDRHPKKQHKQANEEIKVTDRYFRDLDKHDKYVNSQGKWVLTEQGAAKYNRRADTERWYDNGQTQRERKSELAEVNRQIEEHGKKQAALAKIQTTPAATTTTNKTGGKSGTGRTGSNDNSDKLKEIKTPVTESDYENNLRYYEDLKSHTDMNSKSYADLKKKISDIKAEFDKLKVDGQSEELIGHPQSVEEYSHNIQILEDRLKKVSGTENYKKVSEQLEDQKSKLEQFQSVADKSYNKADLEKLSTLKELDDAISFYQNKLNTAKKEEIQGTQETILALQEKRKALQSISDLTTMQANTNAIDRKSGKSRQRAIQKVGVQGLTDQINQLEDMKADGDLTGDQVKQTDKLISTLKKLRKEGATSFDTLKEGWNSVKGIGSGIQSVTDALNGNGNAWQNITGVVDGAIQMYEGFKNIIDIMNALTMAEKAKTTNTATDTTVTEANTGAAIANTSAKSGEAVANATAGASKVPFPGSVAAIAVALAAVVAALGVISSFSTGGIVGGSSQSGDRLLARVNSGEMILNMEQQRRLLAILSGHSFASNMPDIRSPYNDNGQTFNVDALRQVLQPQQQTGGEIKLTVKGRNLVGVLANETRINSVSGRRSNIKS